MGSHVLGPFVVIGNQVYLGNLGSKYLEEPCFPMEFGLICLRELLFPKELGPICFEEVASLYVAKITCLRKSL
jgi:hypothetical protein